MKLAVQKQEKIDASIYTKFWICSEKQLRFIANAAVKDHRHSRWLEEAPLKGA
ncbi:MAG: hypothetical protein LBH43_08640 [Treponema sp.]|nr:hypothetical protein [Treponema sp.]